ncbi:MULTISPECIES: acyl-CoA dehydrogenase [Glycomyces]|uniref:Acyl-CoA dehydrogenase n=2 Tax=Glycomyces TaxID=58113 RepID=A0A9X3T6S6_9ACTN|nr:acyl-CoA dehydrogenase [Glycomyces lechevalierae]MDA1383413.1 acyl-CoA dehydrogenase [Glycomyces lechevalierae]MDR7336419.1 acyl-CoA oxidase [Glycomyces lechevalierae]
MTDDDLRELLSGPGFDRPRDLTATQFHQHNYRRMRLLADAVGPAADLLADRARLAELSALTALRDPVLYHTVLLHYCLCLNGIVRFAPDPDAVLARIRADGATGVVLMTEAGRSNSHGAMRTEARFDPATREFTLRTPGPEAVKFPNTAGEHAAPKAALVYARLRNGDTDHGVFGFLVHIGGRHGVPAGLQIRHAYESGNLPTDTVAVAFDGVRLPFDAWLSDGAAFDPDGTFTDPLGSPEARMSRSMAVGVETWISITAAVAAVSRAATAMAIRYSLTRLTADKISGTRPVLDYRNQHVELLTDLADAYALTALADPASQVETAAAGGAAWAPWSAVDPLLPLHKAVAVEAAWRVTMSCRERCGGLAYGGTRWPLAYQSLVDGYRSAGGDNALIRLDTARNMAANAGYAPPQDDPPAALRTGADFLRLAEACERRLHARLRDRLAAARKDSDEDFAVWREELEAAQDLAGVYAERLLMARFAASVRDRAGEDLLLLHGAGWLRRRIGSLLRCGLAGPETLDAVDRLVGEACDRLLPHAADLVDAFGIDEEFTRSFLAADDYLEAFIAEFGFEPFWG